MMRASAERLIELGLSPDNIWLSMERNMQCAVGHCGHCQFGADFVCKDGPVFNYPAVRELLGTRGF
jgi:NAD(P)H-flavin reductase